MVSVSSCRIRGIRDKPSGGEDPSIGRILRATPATITDFHNGGGLAALGIRLPFEVGLVTAADVIDCPEVRVDPRVIRSVLEALLFEKRPLGVGQCRSAALSHCQLLKELLDE